MVAFLSIRLVPALSLRNETANLRAETAPWTLQMLGHQIGRGLHFVHRLLRQIGRLLIGVWRGQRTFGRSCERRCPTSLQVPRLDRELASPQSDDVEPVTPNRPICTPFQTQEGELDLCNTPPRRQSTCHNPPSPDRRSPPKPLPDFKRRQIEKTMRRLFQNPVDRPAKSPLKAAPKIEEEGEAQIVVNGWSDVLEWQSDTQSSQTLFEI